jgi:hypothetical protein
MEEYKEQGEMETEKCKRGYSEETEEWCEECKEGGECEEYEKQRARQEKCMRAYEGKRKEWCRECEKGGTCEEYRKEIAKRTRKGPCGRGIGAECCKKCKRGEECAVYKRHKEREREKKEDEELEEREREEIKREYEEIRVINEGSRWTVRPGEEIYGVSKQTMKEVKKEEREEIEKEKEEKKREKAKEITMKIGVGKAMTLNIGKPVTVMTNVKVLKPIIMNNGIGQVRTGVPVVIKIPKIGEVKNENKIGKLRNEIDIKMMEIEGMVRIENRMQDQEIMEVYEMAKMIRDRMENIIRNNIFRERVKEVDRGIGCVKRELNERCNYCDEGKDCLICEKCENVRELKRREKEIATRRKIKEVIAREEHKVMSLEIARPKIYSKEEAEMNRQGNYEDQFVKITYTVATWDMMPDRSNVQRLVDILVENFAKMTVITGLPCKGWMYTIEWTQVGTPHLHGLVRLDKSRMKEGKKKGEKSNGSLSASDNRLNGKNRMPIPGPNNKREEKIGMLRRKKDLEGWIEYMEKMEKAVMGGNPLEGTGIEYKK